MPILEVHGLVKVYGSRRVVDGVDFEVSAGEIVGLLGPNGAGKTTSFRMTCGMIEPNAGKVFLDGLDVTHWPMYRRARDGGMGYLAQEPSVFRKLSVQDNLLLGAYWRLRSREKAAFHSSVFRDIRSARRSVPTCSCGRCSND